MRTVVVVFVIVSVQDSVVCSPAPQTPAVPMAALAQQSERAKRHKPVFLLMAYALTSNVPQTQTVDLARHAKTVSAQLNLPNQSPNSVNLATQASNVVQAITAMKAPVLSAIVYRLAVSDNFVPKALAANKSPQVSSNAFQQAVASSLVMPTRHAPQVQVASQGSANTTQAPKKANPATKKSLVNKDSNV